MVCGAVVIGLSHLTQMPNVVGCVQWRLRCVGSFCYAKVVVVVGVFHFYFILNIRPEVSTSSCIMNRDVREFFLPDDELSLCVALVEGSAIVNRIQA